MRYRVLALVLGALVLFSGLGLTAAAIGPVSQPTLEGVDISVWQGEVDFRRLRETVKVVYIRSSYGEREDSRFRENARGAEEAGLDYGFYHFLTAENEAEAQAQARYFCELIGAYRYTCRPVMDFEVFRGLPREQANRVAIAFLTEVERLTGDRPMVYSDAYNATFVFDAAVARYPLWVADYGRSEPDVTANWRGWTGFQYTDVGRVPGIDGDVDRDRFTREVLVAIDPDPDPQPQPPCAVTYTVVRGDTLWGIARRFGTTVGELVRLNHIQNPDLIWVGQVIRIR